MSENDVRELGEPRGPSDGREGEIQLYIRPESPPSSVSSSASVVLPTGTDSPSVGMSYSAPLVTQDSSWTQYVINICIFLHFTYLLLYVL